jgi:hypothetical protein
MSYPRIVGPEALSQFYAIFDEVWAQLVADGVAASFKTGEIRTRLANKLLAFTLPSRWSNIQIKQLLVRAIRNETVRKNRMGSKSLLSVQSPIDGSLGEFRTTHDLRHARSI